MGLIARISEYLTRPAAPLGDRELAAMGLSRATCRQVAQRRNAVRTRMEAMAVRFGVSPQMIDADPALALELTHACAGCQSAEACQNALTLGVDFDAGKCPNASVYADMGTR